MSIPQPYPNETLKPAFTLSLIICLLTAFASLAGLLFQSSIYPTYELRSAFLANEVINLLIGLPILLGSMGLTRRGSLAGLLLWPGALLYILYNYIAYLIGMPLAWISILYLALVFLSTFAIFDLLRKMDKHFVERRLSGVVPEILSGWILIGLGSLFILRGLSMLLQAGLNQITLPMSEIGVLIADLVLSTAWITGGVLLLLRKPLGYASGLGLLFCGSMLFAALIVYLLLGPVLTGAAFSLADVFVVLIMGMVCFIPFFLYLRGVLLHGNPS